MVARLIAGAILLVAACGGTRSATVATTTTAGRPAPTVTTGTTLPTPTTVVTGAPDPAALAEMVAGLCETTAELAAGRAVAARSVFYARSHDTIHLLMDAVRPAEPELTGQLEEAKNALEVRFGYLFQDDDVGAEMDGFVAALIPVLALVEGPVIDC